MEKTKPKLGICYRPWLHDKCFDKIIDKIEAIEVMPDVTDWKHLLKIKNISKERNISLTTHCLKSSLAQNEGYQKENLKNYLLENEFLDSMYYSDHAAFSYYEDKYLSTVQPISFNEKNLEILSNSLNEISNNFKREILIENIVNKNLKKENTMTESTFFNKLMKRTTKKVKLLFDLTNMIVTAQNNKISFEKYIDNYPLEDIKSIHVSGFTIDKNNNKFLDSHNVNINSYQQNVLKNILKKSNPEFVFVERDFNVGSSKEVLEDLYTLKSAIN